MIDIERFDIVIDVYGGMPEIIRNRHNVAVLIRDYDVPDDMDGLETDEHSDHFQPIQFVAPDNSK